MVNLVYSNTDNTYYIPLGECCGICKSELIMGNKAIVKLSNKNKPKIFCLNCLPKIPNLDITECQFLVKVIDEIPANSKMIDQFRPIQLENGRIDVWDMESLKKLGGQTIDHTKYAHDGGGMMELPDRKPLEELDMDMDKERTTDEIDYLFAESRPAKPGFNLLDHILPETKPPELENKQNKQIEDKQK